jgi:hypothetical protein
MTLFYTLLGGKKGRDRDAGNLEKNIEWNIVITHMIVGNRYLSARETQSREHRNTKSGSSLSLLKSSSSSYSRDCLEFMNLHSAAEGLLFAYDRPAHGDSMTRAVPVAMSSVEERNELAYHMALSWTSLEGNLDYHLNGSSAMSGRVVDEFSDIASCS